MSGDWIKMRMELQTHPKVVRILSATSSDKFRVIGGLHAVWCVFDQHSQDGKLFGYTPDLLDHVIGWSGFSTALVAVGWLVFDGIETVEMPEFTEHNGQSAKRRAEDQKRKKNSRKCPQIVRNESDEEEDKKQTREEKRRVNTITPEGFDLFWEAYGKKVGKVKAVSEWKKVSPNDELQAVIIAAASAYSATTELKYRKDPERWIKDQRWLDAESSTGNMFAGVV